MKTFQNAVLLSILFLLPACGQQLVQFPASDAGKADTAVADAAIADHPTSDSAVNDAGNRDEPVEGTKLDANNPDGPTADTSSRDTASIDVLASDAAGADTRVGDSAIPDVPAIDIDTAAIDVAAIETKGGIDAASVDGTAVDVENVACLQAPVVLGAADNFVALAGDTVTNTGPTSLTGDLGVSPGTAVTGFPPGIITGTQHLADPTSAQGAQDLTTAFNDAAGRTLCAVTVAGNLGGQTLTPGLYKSTSSLEISAGDLTLDAQGDANAVFIFQMASTLTTTSGRQVILAGSAKASRIFWQVGTSATLGSTSAFQGTIMADQAITLKTGATLTGRALARIAAVTLDSNTIVKPLP